MTVKTETRCQKRCERNRADVATVVRMTLRRALLISFFVAACDGDGSSVVDSGVDAPEIDTNGSAMNFDGFDPTPADGTLDWLVVGLSLVVVGGSVRSRLRDKPNQF